MDLLETAMSDPVVAQAVADYYRRVGTKVTTTTTNGDVNGSTTTTTTNTTTTAATTGRKRNIRGGGGGDDDDDDDEGEGDDDNDDGFVVPYYQTHPLFKREQERIDAIPVMDLCHSFGVEPLSEHQLDNLRHHQLDDDDDDDNNKNKERGRRIFFGSLIANESWEMIEAHAVEVQDLYHVVAFVESNTTQNRSPPPSVEVRARVMETDANYNDRGCSVTPRRS
jgi:hypothetical protein